jgi:multicomponent Na+:H+ antiporter subunit B
MTPRQRQIVAIAGGGLLFILVAWACVGLPDVGNNVSPYADLINTAAPAERQLQNVVTAINFDYRGVDTLGEEFILFASVAAAALLLRRIHTEASGNSEQEPAEYALSGSPDEALILWGTAIIACTLLFGVYMVYHAGTSPGGGFQGGCVLASAWLVVFLIGDVRLLSRVTHLPVVQVTEAVGAGIYVAAGLGMVVLGGVFLQNLLPLGTLGSPLAGGMIVVINAGVGLEVTAGFVLIMQEFLHQTAESEAS